MKALALALLLLFAAAAAAVPCSADSFFKEPCMGKIVVEGTQARTVIPPELATAIEKRAEMKRLWERRYDYDTSQRRARDFISGQGFGVN